jgi:predicted dehydrogenase
VIALIGAGHMGSSHARVISESDQAELGIVIDADPLRAERVGTERWARASLDVSDALAADAVVIATATPAHVQCALPFLEAGKPVLIEKPLAPTLDDVEKLLRVAEERDVPIMCGFVERFNAALRTAFQVLSAPPTHVMTIRHSPPAPRISSGVVSDMLLHDLDVVTSLFGGAPGTLTGAAGHRPAGTAWHEIADCSISFDSGIANLSANRMGQRKVRHVTVHTGSQLIEVDMVRQNVTVYRNVSQEILREEGGVGYRSSTEIDLPFVRHLGEPLSLQFAHFLTLVDGRGDHVAERNGLRPPHVLMDAIDRCLGSAAANCDDAAERHVTDSVIH